MDMFTLIIYNSKATLHPALRKGSPASVGEDAATWCNVGSESQFTAAAVQCTHQSTVATDISSAQGC